MIKFNYVINKLIDDNERTAGWEAYLIKSKPLPTNSNTAFDTFDTRHHLGSFKTKKAATAYIHKYVKQHHPNVTFK